MNEWKAIIANLKLFMLCNHNIPALKALIVILILSGLLNGCTDQSAGITDNDAVQTMENFFRALSTADTTRLKQITSDDFVLYEHDTIWNRDSLLHLMSATKGRIWEIKNPVVHAEGDIAHIFYYNVSQQPVGRSWYESALLVRSSNKLRLTFMYSTKLYLHEK